MNKIIKDNEAIVYFVGIMQSKGKSENTIRNYLSDLRHFVKSDPHPRGDTLCRGGKKAVEKYTQQIERFIDLCYNII